MNINPQLDDLRLFCVVARHRSFAETARELGISKAVVSKRIALLEAAVHEKLFHRTTRAAAHLQQHRLWPQPPGPGPVGPGRAPPRAGDPAGAV